MVHLFDNKQDAEEFARDWGGEVGPYGNRLWEVCVDNHLVGTRTHIHGARILICACCGDEAPAFEQWHNRDTGYGCCSHCFLWSVDRNGKEEAIRLYGNKGVHHSLTFKRVAEVK